MEIGGYFGLEPLIANEYYKDLIALNTARNALLYILKARIIRKIYIPYYLCDSVLEMCDREGYTYEFYHINSGFLPVFEKDLSDNEYLYIVNYYGQISNEQIIKLHAKYKRIIIDNVQAFFQKPVQGIDTIYSCRKFFGVPDGAYLSTDCMLEEELPEDVSSGRLKHLLGRFETGSASTYYQDFQKNDESYKNLELRKMSKLTHNILGAIDYEKVKKIREENYLFLHEHLKQTNRLILTIPEGPYAYPFYCKNGMELRRKMAELKIYIPTLWPNVLCSDDLIAKDYAENILPLPCDQRYSCRKLQCLLKICKEINL